MQAFFNSDRDSEYPFNSAKKRSSVLITKQDGSLRLYSKGASETSEHQYSSSRVKLVPLYVRVLFFFAVYVYFICS